jgi:hypothetical protein
LDFLIGLVGAGEKGHWAMESQSEISSKTNPTNNFTGQGRQIIGSSKIK